MCGHHLLRVVIKSRELSAQIKKYIILIFYCIGNGVSIISVLEKQYSITMVVLLDFYSKTYSCCVLVPTTGLGYESSLVNLYFNQESNFKACFFYVMSSECNGAILLRPGLLSDCIQGL